MYKVISVLCLLFVVGFAVGVHASSHRSEVMRKVIASTVVVHSDLSATTETQGSGTVIARKGAYAYILTCSHVIKGSILVTVHPTIIDNELDSEDTIVRAVVEDDFPGVDLSILVAKLDVPALPIATADPLLYETVYLAGAPAHEQGMTSEGIITALSYNFDKVNFWRVTNGVILPGISGGTATNADGELVGVPARGTKGLPALGLIIPRNYVVDVTRKYVN